MRNTFYSYTRVYVCDAACDLLQRTKKNTNPIEKEWFETFLQLFSVFEIHMHREIERQRAWEMKQKLATHKKRWNEMFAFVYARL